MILPLADALQNCLQDLTSRIAGVDNEMMTNRGLGMGAAIGYSLGTIKEQFNTPKTSNNQSNSNGNNSSGSGFSGIVSRAKNIINPTSNLSAEKDYNGNINPIRNVVPKAKDNKEVTIPSSNKTNQENISNGNKSVAKNIASAGVKATKAYLVTGYKMAEGGFGENKKKNYTNVKNNMQNTEYITNNQEVQKEIGDENGS